MAVPGFDAPPPSNPDAEILLQQAYAAVQAGDRAHARALLATLLQAQPDNERAWTSLSVLLETREEKIAALERVLGLNPQNHWAAGRLERLRKHPPWTFPYGVESPRVDLDETPGVRLSEEEAASLHLSSPARPFIEAARLAFRQGRKKAALAAAEQAVQADEGCLDAWLALAEITPRLEDKRAALEQALRLAPQHPEARAQVEMLSALPEDAFSSGKRYERLGELELALAQYNDAVYLAPTAAARLEAGRRAEAIRRRMGVSGYKTLDPALTVARLAAGQALPFLALAWLEAGLNPLRLSLPLVLSIPLVLLGSLLTVLARLPSDQNLPAWTAWLQRRPLPGTEELRGQVWLAGMALFLAPHFLLLVDALTRLARLPR